MSFDAGARQLDGGRPLRATSATPQNRRNAPAAMATTFPADAPRSAASITLRARITIPAIAQAIPRLVSDGTSAEVSPRRDPGNTERTCAG
jgi:hypothetical protein